MTKQKTKNKKGQISDDIRRWLNSKYPAFDLLSKSTQERIWKAEQKENPTWEHNLALFLEDEAAENDS